MTDIYPWEACCFLRSSTADGPVSFLRELRRDMPRTVYLKGGYGGAAAAYMERLYIQAKQDGRPVNSYWAPPGRERRCALILPEDGLCVLDAERPCPLEPIIYGAGEETRVFQYDTHFLQNNRPALAALFETWEREQLRCARYLKAARSMKRDIAFVAGEALDTQKVEAFARRFCEKRLPAPNGKTGREQKRFLTCVTGQGLLLRRSILQEAVKTAVILEDETGAVAPLLWESVRAHAINNGLDVIVCVCPLAPAGPPEHLLIPALGLACITANQRHPVRLTETQSVARVQTIKATRFLQQEALAAHRCRLRFSRRTLRELLDEAYAAAAAAEQAKASIDQIYAAANISPSRQTTV